MGLTFKPVDWAKQIALHNVVGFIPSVEGLKKKAWGSLKRKGLFFQTETEILPELLAFRLKTTKAILAGNSSLLVYTHTHAHPHTHTPTPTPTPHTHTHTPHLPTHPHLHTHTHTHPYWFCFSGEPWYRSHLTYLSRFSGMMWFTFQKSLLLQGARTESWQREESRETRKAVLVL